MTLDELRSLDPAAMWDALPREQQMSIVVPLLTGQFAEVCAEDDGTDCSDADQKIATGIVQRQFQEAMDAIERTFPEILGPDLTALHGFCASMLDADGKVLVKGVRGKRVLRQTTRYSESVKIGGQSVMVGGFKNIAAPGEPEVWQAWTKAQVDAERLRRHPEQAQARATAQVTSVAATSPIHGYGDG